MNHLHSRSMAPVRLSSFCAAVLTLLAACGGGRSGSANDPATSDPGTVSKPAGDCRVAGAIEGGGLQRFSGVVSKTSNGGNVVVSDVSFTTVGAKVVVDGATADASGLRVGDAVTVTGEVDLDARSGCAKAIYSDADITATIDAMDLVQGILTVLGQQIRIYPGTVLGDDVLLTGQSALQMGDRIRVTGLYADGAITATRIDRAASEGGYFVAGVVTEMNSQEQTFRINEITVQYREASLVDFPADEPRDGETVRLTGTIFAAGSSSSPRLTVVQPARVNYINYDTPLAIFPAWTALQVGQSLQFQVSGGAGAVTWSISRSDGSACKLTDCGVIDSAGKYTAPTVPTSGLLITAASVAGQAGTATSSVFVHQLPNAILGSQTVRGEVFAFDTGIIEGADVNLWVQQESQGYSYWWAHGPLHSDALGIFEAPYVPDSHFSVYAHKTGFVQPCAVTSSVVGQDVAVRVELMPVAAFDAAKAPRPQMAVEPSVGGVVFETTATGRQPVAGAMIWLEETMGITYATTMSDRSGGYFVCNVGTLPTAAWLTVTKDGFESRSVGPVNSSVSQAFDIELKRL